MKRIALVAGLALMPLTAQAAWFCGEEPTEYARNRVASALSGHRIDSDDITFGRSERYATVCKADKDAGLLCSTQPIAPPTPEDESAKVDDYESRVTVLDGWADTIEDGCLKDAYHTIAAAHKKIIAKDRRAIEFMKTPAPVTVVKSGS